MTVFVETDFLLALAKDDDWLQERAENVLDEREIVTSLFAYLQMLIILERHQFDYIRLFSNHLDVVPVGNEDEQQIVLKSVAYFEDGMTPSDAFHAATAKTCGSPFSHRTKRTRMSILTGFRSDRQLMSEPHPANLFPSRSRRKSCRRGSGRGRHFSCVGGILGIGRIAQSIIGKIA